jgi:hypothetical protein
VKRTYPPYIRDKAREMWAKRNLSKRDRNSLSVCNSDPAVMVLCHTWMRRLTTGTLDCPGLRHGPPGQLQGWIDRLRESWL